MGIDEHRIFTVMSSVVWTNMLIVLLCLVTASAEEVSPAWWTRVLTLDDEGLVSVIWSPDDKGITFEVRARTKGYAAIGFSLDGRMPGSDLIVGWVRSDGVAIVQDMYAPAHAHPLLDEQQSHEFIWAMENDTHTMFRFWRKYDTCDKKDTRITNDTIHLLYAYHQRDPTDSHLDYHGLNRGSKSVRLMEPPRPELTMTPDVSTWDVRQNKTMIPNDKTVYWCKIFKLPTEMQSRRQFIGYMPLVDNVDIVHHIFMYECNIANSGALFEPHLQDEGHECYTATMPPEYSHCSTILAAWGMGSEGNAMPLGVGTSLGEENGGATYFMLEVHYENKRSITVEDSSGLRLYTTTSIRSNEASVLNIGHVVSPLQIIPPRLDNYVSAGHCTSECTQKLIPPSGISIYEVFPQGHYLAKTFKLRHFRNGWELPPIVNEQNFDPYHLESRRLSQSVMVLPGDHLLAECGYNSTEQNETIVGGLSSKQEMCLFFVHYFPRIRLSECQSWPAINLLTSWFNIKLGQQMNDFIVEESVQNQSQTLVEFLEHFQWDNRNVFYEKEIRMGPFMPFCLAAGRFPVEITSVEQYPSITNPYYEVIAECTVNTSVKEDFGNSSENDDLTTSKTTMMTRSQTSDRRHSDVAVQSGDPPQWLGDGPAQHDATTTTMTTTTERHAVSDEHSNSSHQEPKCLTFYLWTMGCLIVFKRILL